MWAVKIVGAPAPKGSMVPFIDSRAPGHTRAEIIALIRRYQLRAMLKEANEPAQKKWRKLVRDAATKLRGLAEEQMATGPVAADLTITLDKPASVNPDARRWPWKKSPGHGDVDKLTRLVFDAITDAHLWTDDAQACQLTVTKCYPHTPGVVDRLDQAGAVLRVGPIVDDPVRLHLPAMYDVDVEVAHADEFVHLAIRPTNGHPVTAVLPPEQARRLARTLEHEARNAKEAVLL